MNVSLPIAAVMLDLGFPAAAVKAVPILARTAGLLAHLAEEQEQPSASSWRGGRRRRSCTSAGRGRLMLEPEVETRPWDEQLALDDESYRTQLAYLFERSAFYREKLAAAGFGSPAAAGGLADIAAPAAHREARAPRDVHGGNPIGAHLCATPARSSGSTRRAARRAPRATSR